MTQFISLTLERPLPKSCSSCPFSNYSQPELYCPVFGDISEWHQHNDHIGEEQRHPDCKLQTWEAQRVLKFFVEDEAKSAITPFRSGVQEYVENMCQDPNCIKFSTNSGEDDHDDH